MQVHWLRFLMLTGVFALGACNGGEDFKDPIPGHTQDPTSGSNFRPEDNCVPRIVGTFIHEGPVHNLGYRCDGFYGTTGTVGLESEKQDNFFVCPRDATDIEFFVGGRVDRLSLGKARFRETAPANQACSASKYDADGPYVFSVADLFDAPVRVDVFDPALESEAGTTTKSRNISALLMGLDVNSAPDVMEIGSLVHSLITEHAVLFDDSKLELDFPTFLDDAGVLLDEIDTAAAAAGVSSPQTGDLPLSTTEADAALRAGMNATAAGVYRFSVFVSDAGGQSALWWYMQDYAIGEAYDENIPPEVALWDGLYRDLPSAAYLDPSTYDVHLASPGTGNNFLPMVVVDRHGRVSGGGAFESIMLEPLEYFCDRDESDEDVGRLPVYLALPDEAALAADLTFDSFLFEPVIGAELEPWSLTLLGRFINGYAYSGVKREYTGSAQDYVTHYPDSGSHVFVPETDATRLSGNLCGLTIQNNQPVLGLYKAAAVTPTLNETFMSEMFSSPGQFTLSYLARATVDANIEAVVEELRITVHKDGSVFTDLYPEGAPDGNPNYDSSGTVPTQEYAIGMVSSAYPRDEEDEESQDGVNLLIFNFGPPEAAEGVSGFLPLPHYGSHFMARLEPGDAGDNTCRDHLFPTPGAAGVQRDELPAWHNPYAVSRAYRDAPRPDSFEAKYEILRTRSYGLVSASRTGCTEAAP